MVQYESPDELLMQIVQLNETITTRRTREFELREQYGDLESIKDLMLKAYEEAKKSYENASSVYNNATWELDDIDKKQRSDIEKLANLRRVLSRLQDSEKIALEYQQRLNEFRDKCSDALWRSENRDDGKGAYQHQIDGAISLAVARRALLGDKRGLGKTLTSIIWADMLEIKKAIIIAPGDTIDNFIREVNMWSKHRSPIKLAGMSKGKRDFLLPVLRDASQFMLVVNYEAWRKDKTLLDDLIALNAEALILDESHTIKTLDTDANKGVRKIRFGRNICPNCNVDEPQIKRIGKSYIYECECGHRAFITEFCSIKNVLLMTGTPILNEPQELYPQLNLVDPENHQSESSFIADFCIKLGPNRYGWAYKGEEKIAAKLGNRYLARTPKTAGVTMPPQTVVKHTIMKQEFEDNYPAQFRAYEQARTYAQIVLDPDRQIAISMPVVITVLLRLRQVLAWPAAIELKWKNPDNPELEESARLNVEESIKLDKAEVLIKDLIEEGHRIIVFSQFKDPLHELQRRLGNIAAIYDGSTSSDMRNQIVQDFDPKTAPDEPRWKVGLFNYRTGGTGLNLHAATQEIMLDREWNGGKEDQAMGRIQRIGQTQETTVHIIQIENTVDAWMESIIDEKRAITEGFETSTDLARKIREGLAKGEI